LNIRKLASTVLTDFLREELPLRLGFKRNLAETLPGWSSIGGNWSIIARARFRQARHSNPFATKQEIATRNENLAP
jgi:hypothetical protein